MFGGGRNTGRNSGIGGIIGNAAQTVVDKVTSTVNTVQNTTRNTFNRATGNHGAVITNVTENVAAQATGGISSALGGSPAVNGLGGITSFVESVAAQVEVARCQGYGFCSNAIQEDIMRDNNPSILFRINSEIINNLHGGNSGYRIYYLNNLDGAKGLGHTAILIVDADGKHPI